MSLGVVGVKPDAFAAAVGPFTLGELENAFDGVLFAIVDRHCPALAGEGQTVRVTVDDHDLGCAFDLRG